MSGPTVFERKVLRRLGAHAPHLIGARPSLLWAWLDLGLAPTPTTLRRWRRMIAALIQIGAVARFGGPT
jgi:hypothetical protein